MPINEPKTGKKLIDYIIKFGLFFLIFKKVYWDENTEKACTFTIEEQGLGVFLCLKTTEKDEVLDLISGIGERKGKVALVK